MSRKIAFLLVILFVGVALDQATKLLVVHQMPLGSQIPVVVNFFNLVHIHNRGAAFGLLSQLSPDFAWLFFVGTTSLVLVVVGYIASFMFPASPREHRPLTLWGWLAQRKNLSAEKP